MILKFLLLLGSVFLPFHLSYLLVGIQLLIMLLYNALCFCKIDNNVLSFVTCFRNLTFFLILQFCQFYWYFQRANIKFHWFSIVFLFSSSLFLSNIYYPSLFIWVYFAFIFLVGWARILGYFAILGNCINLSALVNWDDKMKNI